MSPKFKLCQLSLHFIVIISYSNSIFDPADLELEIVGKSQTFQSQTNILQTSICLAKDLPLPNPWPNNNNNFVNGH